MSLQLVYGASRRPLVLMDQPAQTVAAFHRDCFPSGQWLDWWPTILRDYINATIGFEELSRRTKRPAKSFMRMLGPSGNPQARNLFDVIGHLQRAEGLHIELSLQAAS